MNKIVTLAAVTAAVIGLSGCEVEKTEEGALPSVDVDATAGQLPQYEVDVRKTQDGKMPDVDVDVEGGELPEYTVEGPEVTIGTKEATVDVPTDVEVNVETEEKSFTVPDIDIDLPSDDDQKSDESS